MWCTVHLLILDGRFDMLLLLKIVKMCQLVVSMMWIVSETCWLPDVGCFGNGERRMDDGESGTGLGISITRLKEVKKAIAAGILHPLHDLLS